MLYTRIRTEPQFVILSPPDFSAGKSFWNVETNPLRHEQFLAEMQRFRGKVYIQDGAITPDELTADGRHQLPIDETSWHVLSLDADGNVSACLRYLDEKQSRGFTDLWVRHAALSQCPKRGRQFRAAVEREMTFARRMRLGFGEVGGWAVAEERRRTVEPLRIILATYGLLGLLGGCLGVATATHRHGSASILRRIGLAPLQADGAELPPYYDPQYRCEMEVLRFDSRYPNPKYREWVRELATTLTAAPVICRRRTAPVFEPLLPHFGAPAPRAALAPAAWA